MKTASLVICAVLLGSCTKIDRTAEPLAMPLGPPAGPVTLLREAKGADQRGYDLFQPARPIPVEGGVWVLEMGNDQLVRFDSTLAHADAFGREGEGPGEIQFAVDVTLAGDRLLVAERGNGRVSTFDTTGAFHSTLPTSGGPGFVAVSKGRLLTTLNAGGPAYTYRVDDRGRLTPHAAIPDAIRRMAASDSATYLPAGPYIAANAAGELLVLDQSVLALARFDPEGRLLTVGLLPEPYRSRLLEQRVEQHEGFGALASSFVDSPAAKRISVDREGRLLVLFPLPDAWGLLIDPLSWTARPLLLPEDARLHQMLWAASDAALDGDRLYLISGSQLYELRVDGWR